MISTLIVLASLAGAVAVALLIYLAIPFKYPFRTESDYTYHSSPWWQFNYGHKYLRPRNYAEKGSGLEDYFRGVSFDFDGPALSDAKEFSIRAVGDLMCRRDLVGAGGEHLWDDVGEYLFGASLTVGNMEFAVNPDWFILKLLRFSVTPDFAAPLLGSKWHGKFDYVSIANNHINDSLSGGIRSTCDFLDSQGVAYSGANRTPQEQDEFPIVEVNGAKVALLAYTFSTNNIPLEAGFEHGVNVVRFNSLHDEDYDNSLILRHIELARERGADYIVANNHFSIDLELYPPSRIVDRTHELFEAGIDLVLGHHPHVINPADRYTAQDGRGCLAFYSLGNLTSAGLPFAIQQMSQIAGIDLVVGIDADGNKVVRPKKVELTPVFHSRNKLNGMVINRILPINGGKAAIDAQDPPAYYSKRDIRVLPKLACRYAQICDQRGIYYRL